MDTVGKLDKVEEATRASWSPTGAGTRNVQLDVSCVGVSHATLYLHPRGSRFHPPRALPPPAPACATEAGGLVAEEPRAHPPGHRRPGRRLPAERPTLPRRV